MIYAVGSTVVSDSHTKAASWTAAREVPEATTGYSTAAGGAAADHAAAGPGSARNPPPPRPPQSRSQKYCLSLSQY